MSCICIVTAMPAESRPFIDALALRHQAERALRLYTGEHFVLLQTGIGKLKAAAQTAALLSLRPDISALINIGIAGGAYPIGSIHLAQEIRDAGSGERWYPHLPPQRIVNHLPGSTLITVDKPAQDYHAGYLFDMEAAGIVSAASTYLSTDAISSIKVISDNSDESRTKVDALTANELLQASVPIVKQLGLWQLARLGSDSFSAQVDSIVAELINKVHHSTTEQHALRRLVQQYLSVREHFSTDDPLFSLNNAKAISQYLRHSLASTSVHYDN